MYIYHYFLIWGEGGVGGEIIFCWQNRHWQTCLFYDAENGEDIYVKVHTFSKLYGISVNKSKHRRLKHTFLSSNFKRNVKCCEQDFHFQSLIGRKNEKGAIFEENLWRKIDRIVVYHNATRINNNKHTNQLWLIFRPQ